MIFVLKKFNEYFWYAEEVLDSIVLMTRIDVLWRIECFLPTLYAAMSQCSKQSNYIRKDENTLLIPLACVYQYVQPFVSARNLSLTAKTRAKYEAIVAMLHTSKRRKTKALIHLRINTTIVRLFSRHSRYCTLYLHTRRRYIIKTDYIHTTHGHPDATVKRFKLTLTVAEMVLNK